MITVNVLKFRTLFSFCSHNMFVRIANRKDPDLGLHCLSRPFWQATCVQNFTILTSVLGLKICCCKPRGYKTFFMLNSTEHEI